MRSTFLQRLHAEGRAEGRADVLRELLAARLGPKATRTLEPRLARAAPAALLKLARVLLEPELDRKALTARADSILADPGRKRQDRGPRRNGSAPRTRG